MTLVPPGTYTLDELAGEFRALEAKVRQAADRAVDPTPRLLAGLLEELPRLAAGTAQEAYRLGWRRGFARGLQAAEKKYR